MKKYFTLIALAVLLAACSPKVEKTSYYKGILDYCTRVTFYDVATKTYIDRTIKDCDKLVEELRQNNFYERFSEK